jgi:hypothetical protein
MWRKSFGNWLKSGSEPRPLWRRDPELNLFAGICKKPHYQALGKPPDAQAFVLLAWGMKWPAADSPTRRAVTCNPTRLHWRTKREVASRNQSACHALHQLVSRPCISLVFAAESSSSADWEHALELGELSVNSCICSIEEASNGLLVKGYATAGGSRCVVRVDIGYGEPLTWIEGGSRAPSKIQPKPAFGGDGRPVFPNFFVGELICVRAWDSAANTQPEDPENVWNFKGYMNNAWHRVRFGMPWQDVIVAKPEVEFYL